MNWNKKRFSGWLGVVFFLAFGAGQLLADSPQWWLDRGVINTSTNAIPNDYAVANQGQLKWMATQCAKEMEIRLQGGAGAGIWGMVNAFSSDNNDAVLNVGQLKKIAQIFYDRFVPNYTNVYPQGLSGMYPWSFPEGFRNDYAAVNIGQLKYVFSFDFDAAGLSTVETATVSGSITYTGVKSGAVVVIVSTTSDGWGRAYSAVLSAPGAYSISGLPKGRSYWVRAFRDADGNGVGNGTEPWGNSVLNPLTPTSNVSNVNITLTDAGDDGDGLPDWWELNYFGLLTQNGASDTDGDGLTNAQEFLAGTNPSNPDTDGDGLLDGEDPDPLHADSDANGFSDLAETTLQSSTNAYGAGGVLIHVPDKGWYHAVEPNLVLNPLGE